MKITGSDDVSYIYSAEFNNKTLQFCLYWRFEKFVNEERDELSGGRTAGLSIFISDNSNLELLSYLIRSSFPKKPIVFHVRKYFGLNLSSDFIFICFPGYNFRIDKYKYINYQLEKFIYNNKLTSIIFLGKKDSDNFKFFTKDQNNIEVAKLWN